MASGLRPGDWVGYPVGVPGVGFKGLLDFVGFSVGLPTAGGDDTTKFRLLMGVG